MSAATMGFTPVVVTQEAQVKVEEMAKEVDNNSKRVESASSAPSVDQTETKTEREHGGDATNASGGASSAPSGPADSNGSDTNQAQGNQSQTNQSSQVNQSSNPASTQNAAGDTLATASATASAASSTPSSSSETPDSVSIAPSKDKDSGRGQFSLTPVCQNCQTSTTPLWRRDEAGQVLCNACGLFLKLHGRARPISLKTNVIKSRNRIKNHGHGPGNPAVAHGVQYSVVAASHLPAHVHPHQGGPHAGQQQHGVHSGHPHGPPGHPHGPPGPPPHHGHAPGPGMHVPMHVTHIGHHPPPHMWQGGHGQHGGAQHGGSGHPGQPHSAGPHAAPHSAPHAPLHPMAAMKDHPGHPGHPGHPNSAHYLPPPQQYASPQFREQQSPSLPGFGSLTSGNGSGASGAATPAAGATAPATPASATAPATPATQNSPTLKKITSPLLLSNNPPGALPNSALDQLSAAASQSPYLTGQGDHAGNSGSQNAGPGDLKTRLSELELVNDLFRSRVAEVEAAEQAARRSEASMRESEMLLRSALHRLETRNRVLEKRCKLQQEKLDEAGIKVDDDDDVLEDSDVVLPPLREPGNGSEQAPSGTSDSMTSTTILPASPARRRRSSVGGHESAKREFDGLRKKVRVSDLL